MKLHLLFFELIITIIPADKPGVDELFTVLPDDLWTPLISKISSVTLSII